MGFRRREDHPLLARTGIAGLAAMLMPSSARAAAREGADGGGAAVAVTRVRGRKEVKMPDGVIEDAEPAPAERRDLVRSALDRAVRVHGSMVDKYIARARQRRPDATPAEAVRALERMYRSALTGTGAAVGAAAAVPAVGTGTALALSGGEVLSTLELTALFAFSLAQIHGVPLEEIERRRTLSWGS
jgi:hypothetical protein